MLQEQAEYKHIEPEIRTIMVFLVGFPIVPPKTAKIRDFVKSGAISTLEKMFGVPVREDDSIWTIAGRIRYPN